MTRQPARMRRAQKEREVRRYVGLGLMVIGILVMLSGLGYVPPLSTISLGPTKIEDVPPHDALRVWSGAVLVIIGVVVAFWDDLANALLKSFEQGD